jgi:hypothetical protein
MARLKREHAAAFLFLLLAALLGVDLATSRPLDPFAAPAPLALFSGQAASGGFCATPIR